ncbi:ArnT family glycosyltransferase [Bacillus paralicheniformis]|uniref:ArnT family glycosyltransferase n=3 Tax=Bacillus paralicheniformis TaxID=1648923 RepID=UPI0022442A16|nr:glycosyltransferase family 39 protein [Bacillus paralicheniformis]MEC1021047.1 glycosyltransferase family 39 protein [Bacillus paralicheniformis]MEC1027556.1 glycosyltransferase family 39 protein [Bacillus paralicheniformis]MEC1033364.1 glycosyltransferase family 39 protein [Bacillus paralicheniformis]MEC1051089.1 glycosyltransferase family 39 protein [Bacillus paralicheniformis]MEC1060692.1 glycosyltransferase family 39 protein [Bacillus paralicheniformis]
MKNKQLDVTLILILLAALILNTYNIWQDNAANQYYLAAVKSMTQSFHNFFFASFDSSGFVSVDKPPVVLWIQTIFAKIFGVHTWSVILPQALAGTGSVYLLYALIKPKFGKGAARISALVMALTPIAVAVSRTNNIDSMLVFTLLLGTWCLMKAVKQGRLLWLLAAFGLIGLGFNMKMLQAFMVLPAFLLFYLIAAHANWKKKIVSAVLSLVVLIGVSLSWALAVDYTSAGSRPYVGSSQTNSVLELAFGYNGTERLLGQTTGNARGDMNSFGGDIQQPNGNAQAQNGNRSSDGSNGQNGAMQPPAAGSATDGNAQTQDGNRSSDGSDGQNGAMQPPGAGGSSDGSSQGANGGSQPPTGGGPGGGNGGPGSNGGPGGGQGGGQSMNMFGTGDAGPLRLFQSALSGQISWMLPFALFGLLGMIISWFRSRREKTGEMKESIFWAAWLVPVAGFFSIAGFFHHYYLIMLAPPIAALSGIGWYAMYGLYKNHKDWASYLLPAAVLTTAAFQVYILSAYTNQIGSAWMYVMGIMGLGVTIALLMLKRSHPFGKQLTIISLCVLLLTPVYWSATPILYGGNSVLPESGPQLQSSNGGGMFSSDVDTGLLTYLRKNNTGEEYLFATLTTVTAAPYIINADENVMALGGFNGTDPILSVSELKNLVKEGKVKYFLISDNSGNSELVSWIKENGTEISSYEYNSTTNNSDSSVQQGARGGPGGGQQQTLYKVEL